MYQDTDWLKVCLPLAEQVQIDTIKVIKSKITHFEVIYNKTFVTIRISLCGGNKIIREYSTINEKEAKKAKLIINQLNKLK